MDPKDQIKQDIRAFYKTESEARNSEDWIREGNSPRVPESKSSHYFLDRKVAMAVAMAKTPPSARVLEVGCSFGHQTFLLTQHFSEVVAIDISQKSVDLAERRANHYGVKNVRFLCLDAEDLSPFSNNSFDAVFSFSTVRFCPNPEKALREMHRILAVGGVAVVDFPNKYCPWFGPIKKLAGIQRHIHDHLYSQLETLQMFAHAGLVDAVSEILLFTTKRTPDFLLPLMKSADRVLEALPLVKSLAAIIMTRGEKHAEG